MNITTIRIIIIISAIFDYCNYFGKYLQIYYDFYAEKFSADIAHTLVWEGAVKHKEIKDFLIYVKQRTEVHY